MPRDGARSLAWPDWRNTRDLGGLPRKGGLTRFGSLVRSDHLAPLTPPSRESMRAYGVTTILDLRSASEVATSPSPFAAAAEPLYVHRVLIDDANMSKIGDVKGMFDRYIHIVEQRSQGFREVFEALAEAEGGVVFHCYAGKDRTGMVAAMLLELAAVARDDIAADYGETDNRLAEQYQVWIAKAQPEDRDRVRDELRCPPERILGVLDYIDWKWGGVASYLEAAGVTRSKIDRLRSRLI